MVFQHFHALHKLSGTCHLTRDAWVSAKDLRRGEQLRGLAGPVYVADLTPLPSVERVYNFTVEGEHCYRVSTLGTLVHNCGCEAPSAQVARNWNEFQSMTKGRFATRAEAGQAWTAYKTQHGIVTGIARSSAKKAAFLRQLQKSGNAPKWMNQWLSKGKVPPGFEVDHIKPLSIGGKDIPSNMRLLDKAFHDMHHSPGFYRPWE